MRAGAIILSAAIAALIVLVYKVERDHQRFRETFYCPDNLSMVHLRGELHVCVVMPMKKVNP